MEALWLKYQGLPPSSRYLLRAYLRHYQTGGIDALKQLNYCPQESLLLRLKYFRTNPAATNLRTPERSESRVRAFFKNIG